MKSFFAQLRPMERRLAVGVLVIFILVLNWWFIWPHFSDLGKLRQRIKVAQEKLVMYQTAVAETPKYEAMVKKYESAGQFVAPEDQAINFMHTVQSQAASSGVGISGYSRSTMRPAQFFTEQLQGINVVATDAQLVDFLYKLGSSASMVRVRDLELQPDGPHQHLNANIQLVASYQNKPRPVAAPVPAAAATTPTAAAPVKPSAPAVAPVMKTNSKPGNVKLK
jgi:Tfp pilus assembly protein PilO